MRNPRDFAKPLAIGAPDPVLGASQALADDPFPRRLERRWSPRSPTWSSRPTSCWAISRTPSPPTARRPREGLVRVAKETDFGQTALWTRINSLESPWVLDDLAAGGRDRGQARGGHGAEGRGAWDIHYVDRLLAQLEAKAGLDRPLLVHAILETSLGVVNLERSRPRLRGCRA